MMDLIREAAGPENVYASSADAVWVNARGRRNIRETLFGGLTQLIKLRESDVWDRAWLDGRGRAVVETKGKRYPILTGVPSAAELDAEGRSHWVACDPWSSHPEERRRAKLVMRTHTHDGSGLIQSHDYPAVPHVPHWRMTGAQMAEELLLPLRAPTARETRGGDNER